MTNRQKHCSRCGKPGPFSNDLSLLCNACEVLAAEERKTYHRTYHRARGRAVSRLITMHERQYAVFLSEEREKIEREENSQSRGRSRAG